MQTLTPDLRDELRAIAETNDAPMRAQGIADRKRAKRAISDLFSESK